MKEYLMSFAANWDSDGADPVKPELAAEASRFISTQKCYTQIDEVYPTPCGTPMIEASDPTTGYTMSANIRTPKIAEIVYNYNGDIRWAVVEF